jgi:glutamate carboxypeptidase
MSRRWLSAFESDLPRLVGDLESLVRLESPSDDAARVTQLAAWIRDRLRERGVPAELRPCPPRGDALLASVVLRGGPFSSATSTRCGRGNGPALAARGAGRPAGVFDMKAGIVVGMAVPAAMVRESRRTVSLLLGPDEEEGSPVSRELTLSVARRHRRVLVLEPSQDGAAKTARKGCGVFRLQFSGRAAHAGLEPEKGASALAEMARFILFLEGIAEPARGTTLTASLARAGHAPNVVPETAGVTVDARAWTRDEADRVEKAIRDYRAFDLGVTVAVEGGFDHPPLEPTVASEALFASARRLATGFGLELGSARVGGASDGNFTSAAGIPTLDGLGPRGGGAHARDEHVLVADLPRRAALLAALVSEP